MKYDIKSNYLIAAAIAFGTKTAAAQNGTALDMSLAQSAAFQCVMALDGTNGNAVCKLQHSADGSTDWTDEAAGAGNTSDAATLTADGEMTTLHVVNPRRRYYRVVMTLDVADAVCGAISIQGPQNSVLPV